MASKPLRRASTKRYRNRTFEEIGFSTLPDQMHRKSLKRGFEFIILVTGDSGLGKTTLINTLFHTNLHDDTNDTIFSVEKTVEINVNKFELEEKGVRLKLTVVDTPGFDEGINAHDCWKPIAKYIDEQFERFFHNETGVGTERKKFQDTRVHCCLYFIPSYVRGLRRIDIETMKNLQDRVNIVPVIAKADSLTKSELEYLKNQILNDIDFHDIKIYEFPEPFSDDDEEFKKQDCEIKAAIPFAVIGSNTVVEFNNKRIRGRAYPWGIVDIESDHCDFKKLRTFLCSSHMQDLKDVTNDIHYENFRTKYITIESFKSRSNSSIGNVQDINKIEQLSLEEKDRLIREKELELKSMQELVETIKKNINKNTLNNHYGSYSSSSKAQSNPNAYASNKQILMNMNINNNSNNTNNNNNNNNNNNDNTTILEYFNSTSI